MKRDAEAGINFNTVSVQKLWYNTEADINFNTVSWTEIVIQYRSRHIFQYSILNWNCDTIQRLTYSSIQYLVLKLWYNTEADIYFNTVSCTKMTYKFVAVTKDYQVWNCVISPLSNRHCFDKSAYHWTC